MSTVQTRKRRAAGQPVWDVAELFPAQGDWTEEDYLALPGNRLVELSEGFLEFLPMPTPLHQTIVFLLGRLLAAFVEPRRLGQVLVAPLSVRLWNDQLREPDVVFMLTKHADRICADCWEGADLVMEVVSGSAEDRKRDLVTKRAEYARARIPEYWIVDPREEQITVLRLKGRRYVIHGTFGPGESATSALLDGFAVAIDAVFAGRQA